MADDDRAEFDGVSQLTDSTTLAQLTKSEIDMQVATAHRFPRSLQAFRNESLQMVALTVDIARECIYALPRGGNVIEGPSARFAEVIASAWGNCRAGARIIGEDAQFITAQGVFQDMQRNVHIQYEVRRRIVDKNGKRYNADMIGVTGNAACSIALRNAVLKGIPKAFWSDIYARARQTVRGDFKTLGNRRTEALAEFQSYGVPRDRVIAKLGIKGVEDITIDHLVVMQGFLTSLRDGEATPEDMFAETPTQGVQQPQARKEDKPAQQQGSANSSASAPQDKNNKNNKKRDNKPKAEKRRAVSPKDEADKESENSATTQSPNAASRNVINQLRLRIESYGVDENDCLGFVGASTFEELTVEQVNEAMKWIEENA